MAGKKLLIVCDDEDLTAGIAAAAQDYDVVPLNWAADESAGAQVPEDIYALVTVAPLWPERPVTEDADAFEGPAMDWLDAVYGINRAATQYMIARGQGGAVVHVLWRELYGGAGAGTAATSLANAGMTGFTRSLAMEAGRKGVRVNTVVSTPPETAYAERQSPGRAGRQAGYAWLGRGAGVEDLAAPVAFLLSDDAGYIAGATLDVDGGASLGQSRF